MSLIYILFKSTKGRLDLPSENKCTMWRVFFKRLLSRPFKHLQSNAHVSEKRRWFDEISQREKALRFYSVMLRLGPQQMAVTNAEFSSN